MEKNFDFNKAGKRMPYTVPENFFNTLEENVLREVERDTTNPVRQRKLSLRITLGATAVAAGIMLALVINLFPKENKTDGFLKVEQVFANLSCEDKAYMLEVYQDDVFMNE